MIKQLEFAGQNTREKRSIVRENCGDLQKSLLESLVEYGFVSEDGETLGRSRVKNNQRTGIRLGKGDAGNSESVHLARGEETEPSSLKSSRVALSHRRVCVCVCVERVKHLCLGTRRVRALRLRWARHRKAGGV